MSLLDEARIVASPPGSRCSVALLTSRLDETERAELAEAIASDVSANAIAKALKGRGYDIFYQSINRHRRGDCKCPR